jgi:hypothetical protein
LNPDMNFTDFVINSKVEISTISFVINLLLAGFLSFLLSFIYGKFGNSLSNRQLFGRNFILITMTTMLVITIVKTSLALSLGLVGALSIVRFRAAIKEPEELSYIFIAIGIGLGFGANQGAITTVAFIAITTVSVVLNRQKTAESQNLLFNLSWAKTEGVDLKDITDVLINACNKVELKRFDEDLNEIRSSFIIDIHNLNSLEIIRTNIREINSNIRTSYIDNRRVY